LLRAGQVRFLEDRDPRIVSTVRAVARHLGQERWSAAYRPEEPTTASSTARRGIPDVLLLAWPTPRHIGEVEQAQRRFERLLAFGIATRADAEEADGATGSCSATTRRPSPTWP